MRWRELVAVLAGKFALTLGISAADVDTFDVKPTKIAGNDYAFASTRARPSFLYIPGIDLTVKAIERGADPVATEEIRALLDVWDDTGTPPRADPTKLVVIVQPISGDAGRVALGMLGRSELPNNRAAWNSLHDKDGQRNCCHSALGYLTLPKGLAT